MMTGGDHDNEKVSNTKTRGGGHHDEGTHHPPPASRATAHGVGRGWNDQTRGGGTTTTTRGGGQQTGGNDKGNDKGEANGSREGNENRDKDDEGRIQTPPPRFARGRGRFVLF